ncbi:helix-turn-helix domain-containing protein [Corynebacterium aurimucosum]|uniref:helix-turn-helix domain-containing protein n=1 Tax=Corynebacterium aurimucosum TaxID=169292 RepID=UPI0012FD2604|nr:helix-turn-helix transcriptional regulator [Corynebacterium aurimucosum]
MDPVQLLKKSPLSLSEVSRRSGVSRNTLNLWLRGTAQPSLAGLNKVMRVLGYEVSVSVHRMSDAAAATAARVLLGELISEDPDVKGWIDRFVQWGDAPGEDGDYQALIERAGWASNPYGRRGALHFLPSNPITIASAVDASGQPWAMSGAFAAQRRSKQSAGRAEKPHSTLIWCTNPAEIVPSLPTRIRASAEPVSGGITLVPAAGEELTGATKESGIHYVSPHQHSIDVCAENYVGGA